MATNAIQDVLQLLAEKRDLPRDVAVRAFQIIMNGGATPAQMGAFLMGLRLKGETVDEITAGAIAMRAKAQKINAPAGAIDTCGTGGDLRGTYNISTAVAFVLAGCGLPVAKHGNRSVSSLSGSADVLSVLGVKVDAEIPVLEKCLEKAGIAFLMAPKFHPAMRHVAPVRQELALRTIFNLLGPLSNPAAPAFQLLGVYSAALVPKMANVLKELGTQAAWVVHGADGIDELTLCGASTVAQLKDDVITEFEITPEDAGLPRSVPEELKGGDPQHNANAMIEALSGMKCAYRNAVVLNAAGGLVVAGKVSTLKEGAEMAVEAIDNGNAYTALKKLVEISNGRA
ncbi:MAG: anthranilate phosphoribosyltransferase [Alphaproteobacteria bacterium]|nr:anthranilate phosphoribosyltransferase [Alphaproteobacteria bacterium]